jgi:CubicO group peptidase (beta-lactamase class C family)
MHQKLSVRLFTLLLIACAPCLAQRSPERPDPQIDRIFAAWDRPGSPGCALAVVRDGSLAYARGYGWANLEQRTPITRRTVFDIGSVSKQFTALSIVLLAQDGKLSLDDDVHAYIPELPDYGVRISLRQLLHHLSGLPSYTDLFDLAGVPEADLTTDDDALALIARQRTLNFAPGTRYLYSDTNYFLLALVVRRASGETLRAFAQRRIFGPLGMHHTHFHDDHRLVVPDRATGYEPRADGYGIDMSNFEELGDGSVMTTVDDLVLWDRNFREPVVGGRAAIELLEEPGLRADGSASPYAMGQIRDRYRGRARVQHTGEWVGYRAGYLRFAQERLSIILLCNSVGDLDTLELSERVADHYLGAADTVDAAVAPAPAAGYAGRYWDAQSLATLEFSATPRGTLAVADGDGTQDLAYRGADGYVARNSSTRFVFHEDAGRMRVTAYSDDGDPAVLERVDTGAAAGHPARPPADYAGTYYSEDLGVSWTLALRDGRLLRRQWLFPEQELRARFAEVYTGDLSEGSYTLRFTRDAAGEVEGFDVATTMVRPLHFHRCAPAPAGARGPIALACRSTAPLRSGR